MTKFKAISLFAGVGGIDYGFKQTGKFDIVWANEFDEKAAQTFVLNHKETPLNTNDIRNIDTSIIPEYDILLAGFPCQPFSIAGYRKGLEDEHNGDLFLEIIRIIKDTKPKAVFLENVKNLVSHDNGKTFRIIVDALHEHGYSVKHKVLNATEYGDLPQNRERIYVVAFREDVMCRLFDFPEPTERTSTIHDVIDFENHVDSRYYYNDRFKIWDKIKNEIDDTNAVYQWRRKYVRKNQSGVIPTLTANMGSGGHNVPLVRAKHGIRKLTPMECFKAQGFPDNFKLPDLADSHLYKQAGNSVAVPVIRRIANEIANVMGLDTSAVNKALNEVGLSTTA